MYRDISLTNKYVQFKFNSLISSGANLLSCQQVDP